MEKRNIDKLLSINKKEEMIVEEKPERTILGLKDNEKVGGIPSDIFLYS